MQICAKKQVIDSSLTAWRRACVSVFFRLNKRTGKQGTAESSRSHTDFKTLNLFIFQIIFFNRRILLPSYLCWEVAHLHCQSFSDALPVCAMFNVRCLNGDTATSVTSTHVTASCRKRGKYYHHCRSVTCDCWVIKHGNDANVATQSCVTDPDK